MPDLIKEMVQAIADGTLALIGADQRQKGLGITSAAVSFGTATPQSGGNGIRDDLRATTGYDAATGETTVAFVLGVSALGDDALSA